MPRKKTINPHSNTLLTRYNNNPYFYNRRDSQYEHNLKYRAFIRELQLENGSLRKENISLKKQLTELSLENGSLRKENISLKTQEILNKAEIDLLRKSQTQLREITNIMTENSKLKTENEKLHDELNEFIGGYKKYQVETALKISGNRDSENEFYYLNIS